MDSSRTKEQLLAELMRMQKNIEERLEAQEGFISQFQMLIQNDGLFSQVIDSLPYPVAIFEQNGIVQMANKALMRQANIRPSDIAEQKIKLLNRVTDENYEVFEAVEDVFVGETTVLKNLVYPLELFCRDASRAEQDAYQSAVFFPIPDHGGRARFGAVMLMK